MARAATTTDSFNAIAEPRRREILDLLVERERPVGEIVAHLGLAQPQVSKHLRVLREVGLVAVREEGRRRLYRVEAGPLQQVYDWLGGFEPLWQERLDALEAVVEEMRSNDKGER